MNDTFCKNCHRIPMECVCQGTITMKELRQTDLYASVRRGLSQHAQDVLELVVQKNAYQQENSILRERIRHLEAQLYGGV
jgi:hypothetical protein